MVYDAEGFIEKNRDTLSQTVIETMRRSPNGLIGVLFHSGEEVSATPSKYVPRAEQGHACCN